MASNACFAAFAAAEQVPIIHYYGLEVLTMAKKIMISSLLLKGDKVDVEEFLKNTFPSKKQIILAPYHGGNPFSLDDMPFEHLEEICILKPSNEPAPIVAQHNHDAYNSLRIAVVNSAPDEKDFHLDSLKTFVQNAVLENLAESIHKEFASYYHPVEQQQLLLLGNRKTYSTDKTKIQRLESNKRKEDAIQKKSEARAALPSTSTKAASKNQSASSKPSASAKVSQDDLPTSANIKSSSKKSNHKASDEPKRKSRKEINYREDSGDSTSSVEYPVEGTHTDEESDAKLSDSGNKTPVFLQPPQVDPQPFMTAAIPEDHINFQTRIPKNKKKSSKRLKRTKSPSSDDQDSKPASTRERQRLEKKSSKHKKRSSKKHAKKSRKYSSSSSSSSSSSEEESDLSEQVSMAL